MNYNRGYCDLRAMREKAAEIREKAAKNASCAFPEVKNSLAMVYSPKQPWTGIFPLSEALKTGTVFRQLDLPFYGGCRRNGGAL